MYQEYFMFNEEQEEAGFILEGVGVIQEEAGSLRNCLHVSGPSANFTSQSA